MLSHFGKVFGSFFAFFSQIFVFFANVWHILSQVGLFHRFSSLFYGFWKDFGRILGRFWEGFSMIFVTIIENSDFVKISVFPRENH